jgi:endonuclease/exonuclease/phosphatase (EEP) superfamily protein YafD
MCLGLQPLAMNVLSVPAMAYIIHRMGAERYGQWAIATSLLAVFAVLANLGLRGAFVRAIAAEPSSVGPALAEQLGLRLSLTIPVGVLVLLTCAALGYPGSVLRCSAIAVVGLIVTTAATTLGDVVQSFHRIKSLAAVSMVSGVALTGVSVAAAWWSPRPEVMAAAYLVGPVVTAVLLLVIVSQTICPVGLRWAPRRFVSLLAGSRFFAAQQLLFAGSNQAESLLSPRIIGMESFGNFAAGATLGNRLVALPDALCAAAYPTMVQAYRRGAGTGVVLRYFVIALSGGGAGGGCGVADRGAIGAAAAARACGAVCICGAGDDLVAAADRDGTGDGVWPERGGERGDPGETGGAGRGDHAGGIGGIGAGVRCGGGVLVDGVPAGGAGGVPGAGGDCHVLAEARRERRAGVAAVEEGGVMIIVTTPRAVAPPLAPRARRPLLLAACWGYLAVVVALWLVMRTVGDRHWVGTVMLMGPRWPYTLPLILLWPWVLLARRWKLAMVPAAATLGVLTMVMGFRVAVPSSPRESADRGELRLMQCNIHRQNLDAARMGEYIDSVSPDVVALQGWSDVHKGSLFADGWQVRREGELLLASRFPIGRITVLKLADEPGVPLGEQGSAALFEIRTPRGTVNLISLHLASPHAGLNEMWKDHGEKLAGNVTRRWRESERVRELADGVQGPLLLCGDFNTVGESPIFREKWGSFADAFKECGAGFGYTYLINHTQLRIDHILAGESLRFERCWVGPDVSAAHRPLVADVDFR